MEDEALEVMMIEAERRLEPNRLFAYLYTQLDPLTRMPRRLGHVLSELEQGSLKVGVVPTGLDELEANLRSIGEPDRRRDHHRRRCSLRPRSSRASTASSGSAFAGFCVAVVLGLYMVWKIIRTPGEL